MIYFPGGGFLERLEIAGNLYLQFSCKSTPKQIKSLAVVIFPVAIVFVTGYLSGSPITGTGDGTVGGTI